MAAVSVIGGSDCGLNTVLAGFFHRVHRLVRGRDELIRGCGHVGQGRHADRPGQMNVQSLPGEELVGRNPLADALSNRSVSESGAPGAVGTASWASIET